MELLIVSDSTQCPDDQGEYAKFVMYKTLWKKYLVRNMCYRLCHMCSTIQMMHRECACHIRYIW